MYAIVISDHYMIGYQIKPLIWTGKIKCVVIEELQQLMQVRESEYEALKSSSFFAIFEDFSKYGGWVLKMFFFLLKKLYHTGRRITNVKELQCPNNQNIPSKSVGNGITHTLLVILIILVLCLLVALLYINKERVLENGKLLKDNFQARM